MPSTALLPLLLSLSTAQAQPAPPPPPPPPPPPAPGHSQLVPMPRPTALLQVWVTAYDMDESTQADPASYGDPEDDIGAKIRRARVGVEGEGEHLRYEISVGVGAPYDALTEEDEDVQLVDATVGVSPVQGLWFDGGVMKPPLSREQLMRTSELPLAERAVSSEWLVPGRQAGALVDWGTDADTRVRLRGGAFNGNGGIFGDDDSGKLFAARVEMAHGPAKTYQTWGPEKGFTLGVAADGYYDWDNATKTASVGGDLILRVAGFHLLAEGRFAQLEPTQSDVEAPGVFAKTTRIGGLAQVGYGIGPVEPVVRFSLFDDDADSDDNGDLAALDVGVTGHLLEDAVRVGGGYVLRLERGGSTIDNDTVRLWLSLRY